MYEGSEVLEEGIFSILAHVKEKKSDKEKLKEVLVIREITRIFPEDLPKLSPSRQIEISCRYNTRS